MLVRKRTVNFQNLSKEMTLNSLVKKLIQINIATTMKKWCRQITKIINNEEMVFTNDQTN